MNSQNSRKNAEEALNDLIKVLLAFNDEQINQIPFEGSWTAGQLARHMIMANSGFVQVMNGPVKDTERSINEVEPLIERDFLNFDIKMNTPDMLEPEMMDYKKAELLSALDNIRSGLNKAAETLDLTKTCTAFELPVYGFLTRMECLCFIYCHTTRHVDQLRNIYQRLTDKKY